MINWQNTENKYGIAMRLFHNIIALLVIAALILIEMKDYFPKGSMERDTLKFFHAQLGISIFILTILRISWRFTQSLPKINPQPPRLQNIAAHLMHALLNLMLLMLPIFGMLMLNAKDKSIKFFGLVLPNFVAPNQDLAHLFEEIHETIGEIIIFR